MQSSSVAISPVNPAAPYIGGKRNLARKIVPVIDALDNDGYAEPFVGMGGIFLRRQRRAKAEVINDVSGDVTNFFRIVREHYPFFMESIRGLPPQHLTDLQRAVRFLYVQRLAFGGKVAGRNFGVDSRTAARFNVLTLERDIADLHDRLAGVVVEQLDFERFIARYDRPGMLFYLDPPYWGCEGDYGPDVFAPADFARLAAALEIRGRFIMSINDTPGVRECFAGFEMLEVETTYTIGAAAAGGAKRVGELLVSNFPIALT